MSRTRRLVFSASLALLATLIAAAAAEIVVRRRGIQPWSDLHQRLYPREPPLLEPDAVRGWRNRPGRHEFPGYSPDVDRVRITIWPDFRRATAAAPVARPERVLLVGDSITAGWAISDEETFGWKLQSRFPGVEFDNLGTGGYGTYQSLLAMRDAFAGGDGRIGLVLYGLIDDHEHRNVADFTWTRAVAAGSRFGRVAVPYALLASDGGLEEHAPASIPRWPLRAQLATVRLLEEAHWRLRTAGRTEQGQAVTERLVVAMDELARRHGAAFMFVSLISRADVAAHYRDYLSERGIAFLDCSRPLVPAMAVRGEGHPNGALNSEWAACIGDAIAPDVERLEAASR